MQLAGSLTLVIGPRINPYDFRCIASNLRPYGLTKRAKGIYFAAMCQRKCTLEPPLSYFFDSLRRGILESGVLGSLPRIHRRFITACYGGGVGQLKAG